MGADARQVFFKVILPAAAPQIFTGLRVALALAFILMFSSEMIGSSNRTGLGFLILNADSAGRYDRLFAAVLAIAALGFASDRVLLWVRARLLPYGSGRRAAEDYAVYHATQAHLLYNAVVLGAIVFSLLAPGGSR